jgi:hypothetical protein
VRVCDACVSSVSRNRESGRDETVLPALSSDVLDGYFSKCNMMRYTFLPS